MSDSTKLDAEIRKARRRALAATDAHDPLDALQAEIQLRLLDRTRDVARHAVRFADGWLRLAERIEGEPLDHSSADTVGGLVLGAPALDAYRASMEVATLKTVLDDIERAKGGASR